jgi:hypothetical protein
MMRRSKASVDPFEVAPQLLIRDLFEAWTIPSATNPCKRRVGKSKTAERTPCVARARSPDPAHDTSGNNHSNSKDRKRTSHALASPLGGAGSAMLFSVAAAI